MPKFGAKQALFITICISLCTAFLLFAYQPFDPATLDYSTEVTATDGETLRLYTTRDGYWRLPADSDKVDPRFIEMLLAYEDKRFSSHPGVDLPALARAAWQALVNGRFVSGASTLSMQTVRLLHPRPRTLVSKLIEMWQALRLERRLSKRQILDLYLSLTPYGGNLQGIRAASRFYFGKEPGFLTNAESALLVALPQSPEGRRPDRHPQAAKAARDSVLERMLLAGVLDEREAGEAGRQALPPQRLAAPRLAPHLADRLRAAEPGKQRILTSVDGSLQRRLQAIAERHQPALAQGVTLAALVLDNGSGAARAYLGSGDYLATRFPGQVDMVRALRSPGSTLKPFIYGMGFDAGFLHPDTLVNDRPGTTAGYAPGNFDHRYEGELSVREALRQSRNVPAVRVLQRLGPSRFVRTLEQAGVKLRLPDSVERPGLPVALGGVGISLEQLAALYASLAVQSANAPLSPVAAWYLTDILRDSPLPPGYLRSERGIAFKTGTSYGFRDAWALGYDADHTVAVWLGRPDGGYTPGLSGLHAAVPVMLEIFDQLPGSGLAPLLADAPDGVLRPAGGELPPGLRRLDALPGGARDGDSGPRILYPPEGGEVEVAADGEVLLEIGGGRGPYHWLVNGRYLGQASAQRKLAWTPPAGGTVQLTVLDSTGRSDRVRFRVKAGSLDGAASPPIETPPAPPG